MVEKTPRGRGQRGEVVWYRGLINQEGKVVQEGELSPLSRARPLPKVGLAAAEAEPETIALPSTNGTA